MAAKTMKEIDDIKPTSTPRVETNIPPINGTTKFA
jgi:hypothetical protein